MIGSHISKYNQKLVNKILVKSKGDYISNWKNNLLKYILHSVFKSFTNMKTDLASVTLVHTTHPNRHPATDLLCNTKP